jgi:hypothetical protein
VDNVVAVLDQALAKQGQTLKSLETWKAEMPTEAEMLPRDKYTIFDRKEKRYRKGIHSTILPIFQGLRRMLTRHRVTEVDTSLATGQPSWILDSAMLKSSPLVR